MTGFLDCFDLLKETGIHSVFIITVSAEQKTPLANVLTLSHWIDTFSPLFAEQLTRMSFKQSKLHCFSYGNQTETLRS